MARIALSPNRRSCRMRTKGQRSSLTGSPLEYIKMQQHHLHADSYLRIVHGTDIVAMAPFSLRTSPSNSCKTPSIDNFGWNTTFKFHGVLDSKGCFRFEKMHIFAFRPWKKWLLFIVFDWRRWWNSNCVSLFIYYLVFVLFMGGDDIWFIP